jgi:hypothetical protein
VFCNIKLEKNYIIRDASDVELVSIANKCKETLLKIDERKNIKATISDKEGLMDSKNNMYIIDIHDKDDSIVKPKKLDFINEVTCKTADTLKSIPNLDDSFGHH